MTDIQVRFNQLRETERANRAQEALKSDLQSAQIRQLIASSNLSDAQREKVSSEIDKLRAEIERINADTSLTKLEMYTKKQRIAKSFINQIGDFLGINQAREIGYGLINSFGQGAGKAAGTAFGSGLIG